MNKIWKNIRNPWVLKRVYLERLGEPLIYNIISIFVLFFGNFIKKIEYDLVPRQPYAFGLNEAFKSAVKLNTKKVIFIEFGVAAGAGLFNLAYLARKLSKYYEIDYEVIGFDTGKGMPKPIDYRDHPEKYRTGDFPPLELIESKLPEKTKIVYGDIGTTLKSYFRELSSGTRIAFVSIDVDYYSSTVDCLEIFSEDSEKFLPSTVLYLDDVNNIDHNQFCGEMLAVNEFNQKMKYRKISKMTQLRNWRIFKNALWLDQMYFLHVLDSNYRDPSNWENLEPVTLRNPFL